MRAFLLTAALLLANALGAPVLNRRCQVYLCERGYTDTLGCSCPPDVAPHAPCLAPPPPPTLDGSKERRTHCPPQCKNDEYARALAAFQAQRSLAVTGICDLATLAAVTEALQQSTNEEPAADAMSAEAAGRTQTTATPRTRLEQSTSRTAFGLLLREAMGRVDRKAAAAAAPFTTSSKRRERRSSATEIEVATAVPSRAPSDGSSAWGPTQANRGTPARRPGWIAPIVREAEGRPRRPHGTGTGGASGWSRAAPSPYKRSLEQAELAPANPLGGAVATAAEAGNRVAASHELALNRRGPTGGSGQPGRWSPSVARQSQHEPLHRHADDIDTGPAGRTRHRRTVTLTNSNSTFGKKRVLRWRIIPGYYYPLLSAADQEGALALALRKWAAVTPLCFIQDKLSNVNTIDILIAFVSGVHFGDGRPFNGPGGVIAHTNPAQFTHFDASESWYIGPAGTATGYQLTAAAVHEFGHILGLQNTQSSSDVMYGAYNGQTSLSEADRAAAAALYGSCKGSIDAIVDVLYMQNDYDPNGNPITIVLYSTVIFRGAMNWLYKNSDRMPLDGEPKLISATWGGIPNSVDAVVQYSSDQSDGSLLNILLIFKGSDYYVFDYVAGAVTSSGSIALAFKAGPSGQPIPNNVDSAFFDPRDKNIYFFKDSTVYAYRYDPAGNHSCCVFVKSISEVFPLAPDQPSLTANATYQRNVDAAYFQQSSSAVYFFVGDHVWISRAANYSFSVSANSSDGNEKSTTNYPSSTTLNPRANSSASLKRDSRALQVDATPPSGGGAAGSSSAPVSSSTTSSSSLSSADATSRGASPPGGSSGSRTVTQPPPALTTTSLVPPRASAATALLSSLGLNRSASLASVRAAAASLLSANGTLDVANSTVNYNGLDDDGPEGTLSKAFHAYTAAATTVGTVAPTADANTPTILALTSTTAAGPSPATTVAGTFTAAPAATVPRATTTVPRATTVAASASLPPAASANASFAVTATTASPASTAATSNPTPVATVPPASTAAASTAGPTTSAPPTTAGGTSGASQAATVPLASTAAASTAALAATAPPTTAGGTSGASQAATLPPTATAPASIAGPTITLSTATTAAVVSTAPVPPATTASTYGNQRIGTNQVQYYGLWSTYWRYVCQVDC